MRTTRVGSATVRPSSAHTILRPSTPSPWPPRSLGTSICQSPSSLQRAVRRVSISGLSFWPSSDLPSIGINSSLTNRRTMSRSIRNSSGSSISTVYSPVGTTRHDVARRSQSRHGWPPYPQPNSGLPEFGHLLTWPKSETSDFGWGEGGGEGGPTSRWSVAPHPTPLPSELGLARVRHPL